MGFFASAPRWYRLGTALALLWALFWCIMVVANVPLAPAYWGEPPSVQARFWVETPYAIRSGYVLWTLFTLIGGVLLMLRRKSALTSLAIGFGFLLPTQFYLLTTISVFSLAFFIQAMIALAIQIVAGAWLAVALRAHRERWMR